VKDTVVLHWLVRLAHEEAHATRRWLVEEQLSWKNGALLTGNTSMVKLLVM
jgi:hypothetical protein